MYNLLNNAYKFTPENGTILIKVSTIPEEIGKDHSGFFELNIIDSGPGISPEDIPYIFNRFYRKGNIPGTGIGLAFTKSLVELHCGEIKVSSQVGQGAQFTVRLPLDKSIYQAHHFIEPDPDMVYPKRESLTSSSGLAPTLSNDPKPQGMATDVNKPAPLIILIDDNEDFRNYLKEELQKDFRVLEAENGQVGHNLILAHLPDIIICDVSMPVLNGIELCARVKYDDRINHIPVILLTAKSSEEHELEGRRYGADAYINKPFNSEMLRLKLFNLLSAKAQLKKYFYREKLLEPRAVELASSEDNFLQNIMEIIEKNISDSLLSVETLAREMGISQSKLYTKIKTLTSQSPNEFIRTVRLKRAVQLMEVGDYSIKEITSLAGFNTPSYFTKCFKKQYGVLPSEYLIQIKTNQEIKPI